MKTVVSGKDLPDWFDLNRYSHLGKLSYAQLISELVFRTEIQSSIVYPDDIDLIANKPTDSNRLNYCPFSPSVSELTISDVYEALRPECETEESLFILSSLARGGQISEVLHDINPCQHAYFMASLDVKDSELVEGFKAAIKRFRVKHNIPDPHKSEKIETTFSKVISYRAIPYIDLKLWAQNEEVTISNRAMVRILYPDNWDKSDRDIRDYTAKYAGKALSTSFISSAQAWIKRK